MKYTENETTKKIVEDFKEFLSIYDNYDKLVKDLDKGTGLIKVSDSGYSYNINEFWDGDAKAIYGITGSDGFDLDFGLMGFTIYRDGKDGIKLNTNASYYVYNEQEEFTNTIDVEL